MKRTIFEIVVIILAWVLIFVCAVVFKSHAHDIHFSTWVNDSHPVVAQGWVEDVGFIIATDSTGDGHPDNFWLVYKDGDLQHHQGKQLHVRPLTYDTASKYLILKENRR